MKKRVIPIAGLSALFSAAVLATPAMTVLTVNTGDPMAYAEWTKSSGEAIAKSVGAGVGGICLASGGYYKPGELYYWHLFDSHASAMGANSYNKTIMGELKKLPVDRVVNRSDVYSVVMPSEGTYKRGDTFANWNVVVETDQPSAYMSGLQRMQAAAAANGFGDISFTGYSYQTGPETGNMMVVVQGPSGERVGAFLDQTNSSWGAPIMAEFSGMRHLKHGFTMNCEVVYSAL